MIQLQPIQIQMLNYHIYESSTNFAFMGGCSWVRKADGLAPLCCYSMYIDLLLRLRLLQVNSALHRLVIGVIPQGLYLYVHRLAWNEAICKCSRVATAIRYNKVYHIFIAKHLEFILIICK
jgi:hypothetical protein